MVRHIPLIPLCLVASPLHLVLHLISCPCTPWEKKEKGKTKTASYTTKSELKKI